MTKNYTGLGWLDLALGHTRSRPLSTLLLRFLSLLFRVFYASLFPLQGHTFRYFFYLVEQSDDVLRTA